MTARDLSEKLNYLGMVRGIRKLALEPDEIGFMEKEKYAEYQKYLKEISR